MLHDSKMRDLPCRYLQSTTLWGFIGKKQRNVRTDEAPRHGDVWTLKPSQNGFEARFMPLFNHLVRCNQAAVTMRLCAGLAGTESALFSGSSAASWTRNSKGLLWVSFSSHGREIMPKTWLIGMFNFEQSPKGLPMIWISNQETTGHPEAQIQQLPRWRT